MTVLVVGGAGYIGSHMNLHLQNAGYSVVVLDDLSSGHREYVRDCQFIEGKLDDKELLKKIFNEHGIECVMHFAAHIEVGESVQNPAKYYRNNVHATQVLLDSMLEHNINKFIFSSTAAIFGIPDYTPIDESHSKNPINPYGHSKLMVEQILQDYDRAYDLKSICLRYFNAAGADPKGRTGECHNPEKHLIPLVLQAASGRKKSITIFGNNYDTPDGTCIRDYIHVDDLCQAHLLALIRLNNSELSEKYNLGNGKGYSVQEVIDAARSVTGKDIEIKIGLQREGDPAVLVADAQYAKKALCWEPKYSRLKDIISHAWNWECQLAED